MVPLGVFAQDGVVARRDDRCQPLQTFLGPFAVRDIDQHIDGAGQRAAFVEEWRRIGNEESARTIGPLGYRLRAPDRALFFQSYGHRAFIVTHRPAIRPVQTPRAAPLAFAKLGPVAPERSRRLIVVR
jgi:hypothetical protein